MAIFVSYSHANKDFVDRLGANIVKNKGRVWIDRWELGVGDPLIQRIQDAIAGSSAMLVVLSKDYVESEFCKKELNVGLIRELEEKRVVVLPLLLEDCAIPVFLKDKLYADFRTDFEAGLKSVLEATARVTNAEQSRIESPKYTIDWSEDWWFESDLFCMRFTVVDSPKDVPITLVTEITVRCNDETTKRYRRYVDAGLDWIGRAIIAEALFDIGAEKEIDLLLDSTLPSVENITLGDSRQTGMRYDVTVSARRLGVDTGKIQLVHASNYLRGIRDYVKSVSRKMTDEESRAMMKIMET